MNSRQARRVLAHELARLEAQGPAAQRHWLSQHGVRFVDRRAEQRAGGLSSVARLVGDQLLEAVADEIEDGDQLRGVVHPAGAGVPPPVVLGAADARPGSPTGKGTRGETLFAYGRDRTVIGWMHAELSADGTVTVLELHTAPTARRRGVAEYLLRVGQGHFGAWRTWTVRVEDPELRRVAQEVAARHGIRLVAQEPVVEADDERHPASEGDGRRPVS